MQRLQAGLYNPSVPLTLNTSAQEISIFTTFLRHSPPPTPNSFSMATINLNDDLV
jgi:hypothetical protein